MDEKKEVVGWATLDKFFIFKKCVLTQWNPPRTRKFLVKPLIQGKLPGQLGTSQFWLWKLPGFGRKILVLFVPYYNSHKIVNEGCLIYSKITV